MGDTQEAVFVYGTLLPTLCRHGALQGAAHLGSASVRACLHDLGEYPGMVPGDGLVLGEVYAVDQALLDQLDAVEEVVVGDDASSLYLRRMVMLHSRGPAVPQQAWTYVYNRPVLGCPLIADGDYRRYLSERSGGV